MGKERLGKLSKLNIFTPLDLAYYFPRALDDRRFQKSIESLIHGEVACICARVVTAPFGIRIRDNLTINTITFADDSGVIDAVFYNSDYVKNVFKLGDIYCLYGKIKKGRRRMEIQCPVFEAAGQGYKTGRIVPIYPLTGGLSGAVLSSMVRNCLELMMREGLIEELLPLWVLREYQLMEISSAIFNMHFPDSYENYQAARRRMAFDELFNTRLKLSMIKQGATQRAGIRLPIIDARPFIANIPYEFTEAQKRVANQIVSDLKSGRAMNRLVSGDVGSGKTVLAALALYLTAKSGYQAVMMAPTEILAMQHRESLVQMFEGLGIEPYLLTGSTRKKEREYILNGLTEGNISVVVGTHALITDKVKFKNLALAITDEQHRFGVNARLAISNKVGNDDDECHAHIMVMTATPIPRTLALTLYGDMDISVIDQLPVGRKPILTYHVDDKMRDRVYKFVRKQAMEGRQAYVICPTVEENQNLKSVEEFSKALQSTHLEGLNVDIMHGKLSTRQKDRIMNEFLENKIQVLVSTTVVEVGVNVPNATIIVIENAERFGLSQLHQLRGRVGRGQHQSYAILFNCSKSDISRERMEIMTKTNLGGEIAQKDLELRGPGDFFGTKQHGLPPFKVANLFTDTQLMSETEQLAKQVLSSEQMREEFKRLLEVCGKATATL